MSAHERPVGGVLAAGHGADPAGVGLDNRVRTLGNLRAELPHLTGWACALAPEADSAPVRRAFIG